VFVLLLIANAAVSEGGAVTLEWDPPTDTVTRGYIVRYGTAPGSYSQAVDAGYTTSHTIDKLTNGGTYYFTVQAYDAVGQLSETSTEVAGMVPAGVVSALALTSDVPSPQVVGSRINWSASAAGGTAPYEFQWSLYQASGWAVGSWTSAATWSWVPSAASSDYVVRVAVRSSGSPNATGEMSQSVPFIVTAAQVTAVSITSNLQPPQRLGKTVRFAATAAGGTGAYEYRWFVWDGTTWTAATRWTGTPTWSWSPAAPNDRYAIRVWVRSLGATTDVPEATASIAFPITSKGRGK
jgi:hypothetical protein